ncbi:hypothetical protein TCAL_00728 [Tigriopus californicus]|uniref:Mevalonate kinase n=1 Tax=Tigriopus californicus TaxID=6832 RepID=A0A553PCU4_TIGCA|nr:mevalonate kinase-like [Tigriopus californicus]TRY75506.1 hypothetical protein TCAL_00728 [Tigriopus californicus]|eukprot:TCALIF_00728-PA protein Name:"Similar to MVK Mevalonate kinase (Bos taurus)" AED:0.01 eAED:0.01 QI:0/-1/0/1/-1/1/1/0/388
MAARAWFKPVVVSAPSKLILHGEHAVVYGRTALAASLGMRTHMTIEALSERVQVDFPDIGVRKEWPLALIRQKLFPRRPPHLVPGEVDRVFTQVIHDFLGVSQGDLAHASLICFFYLFSIICDPGVGMAIHVRSEIPIGAGLGSSAALSVCLATGLLAIQAEFQPKGCDTSRAAISDWAFLSEKILHGTPSGVDNAISTFGGLIRFAQGRIEVQERLPCLRILLVNTQVSRRTKDLVDRVRVQHAAHPRVIGPIFDAISGVSESALAILRALEQDDTGAEEHYGQLAQLIEYNQQLLRTLNVSHASLDLICAIALEFGLQAKLTGAGGGGFAFVLLPPSINEKSVLLIRDRLEERGFVCQETELGVEGVVIQPAQSSDSFESQPISAS